MRVALFVFVIWLTTCGGEPPPCEAPTNCLETGGQWTGEPECRCNCPEGLVYRHDLGCACPVGEDWSEVLDQCAPKRRDQRVNWRRMRGVTAFSLVLQDPEFQWKFVDHVKDAGWNTLRIGAWPGWDWCDKDDKDGKDSDGDGLDNDYDYLPCGPGWESKKALENLEATLEITSRIPEVWVSLIPTLTYKSVNKGSQEANIRFFNSQFDRANAIVKKHNYKHVVWEAFNEFVHPLSEHHKDEDALAVLKHMRINTRLPVGMDHGGGRAGEVWQGRYPYIWRGDVDYVAFHTPRNPEPPLKVMEEAQRKYGYSHPVVINETVAWCSDDYLKRYKLKGKGTIAMMGWGSEAQRMNHVLRHLRDIYQVKNSQGIRWIPWYHSVEGIDTRTLFWIPDFDLVSGGN